MFAKQLERRCRTCAELTRRRATAAAAAAAVAVAPRPSASTTQQQQQHQQHPGGAATTWFPRTQGFASQYQRVQSHRTGRKDSDINGQRFDRAPPSSPSSTMQSRPPQPAPYSSQPPAQKPLSSEGQNVRPSPKGSRMKRGHVLSDRGHSLDLSHLSTDIWQLADLPARTQQRKDCVKLAHRINDKLVRPIFPGLRTSLTIYGSVQNRTACDESDVDLQLAFRANSSESSVSMPHMQSDGDVLRVVHRELIRRNIPSKLFENLDPAFLQFHFEGRNFQLSMHSNDRIDDKSSIFDVAATIDARALPFVVGVKSWAQNRRIASTHHNTLSGFGWSCLAIHFLQYERVLPFGSFWRRSARTRWRHQDSTRNASSVGELYVKFFDEYMPMFDGDVGGTHRWVSIRLSKRFASSGSSGSRVPPLVTIDDPPLITIDDPTQFGVNVSRKVTKEGWEIVQEEVQNLRTALLDGSATPRLVDLAPTVDKSVRPPFSFHP